MNGQRMGFALGVSITENIRQEPIVPLDSIEPVEFETLESSITVEVRQYKIPNEDLVSAGLYPQSGRTPDERKLNLLDFPPLNADVYDSKTGDFLYTLNDLVPTSRRVNVDSRGVVVTNYSFVGTHMSDEGSSF
jgi:hypothetical protein